MKFKFLFLYILFVLSSQVNGQPPIETKQTEYEFIKNQMIVLKNEKQLLPIINLDNKTFAFVNLGDTNKDTFYTYLRKYAEIQQIEVKTLSDLSKLKKFDYVIVTLSSSVDKVSNLNAQLALQISKQNTTILCTEDKYLTSFNSSDIKALITYPQNNISQIITPQIIFGARGTQAKLPGDIGNFKKEQGIEIQPIKRLSYGLPEEAGMNAQTLSKIDNIAQKALNLNATPGMQVLVARKGMVVWEKSYGYTDTSQTQSVTNDIVYDIASITKITATLPMVFKLKDEGKFSYDQTLGSKLKESRGTNKENLTFREILAHQAGLKSWIPFYKSTLDSLGNPSTAYYTKKYQEGFPLKVADNLFLRKDYPDSIYATIYQSKLGAKKYEYSDLGYFLIKKIIENERNSRLDMIVTKEFYKPLGAYSLRYNPLNTMSIDQIAPTEWDKVYRKQLLRGYVHDQGTAMLGGVAGHAGLFSTANDLAKVMQMYLQKGYYGGKQYIQPETIEEAIKTQYRNNGNRRGIGFDKKPLSGGFGQTCKSASANVFGHSGFTGTIVWMDPDKELLFIFLSNRLNANAESNVLSKQNIREDMFQTIYDAIEQ